MKPDPEMVAVLCAGLEAMNFIETASRGNWRRFGKFRFPEGDAYYVTPEGELWYSELYRTTPGREETGPFRDRVFEAGMKARKPAMLDPDAALDELTGGSDGHDRRS